MAEDYSVGSNLTNVFVENNGNATPLKTGLVFAGRTLGANNTIIAAQSNNVTPCLYKPFELGTFATGLQALAQLKLYGYQYVLGIDNSNTFVAPDSVVTNSATGLITLTWNDPLMGIQYLVGQSPTGSIIQNVSDAVATIQSVAVDGNQSIMIVSPVNGTFDTTNTIEVSAVLANPAPDPAQSDEICVAAWAFFNQSSASALFNTKPTLWCSVYVTGRDVLSPTATPIPLVAPTTAVTQPDGSINLTYPITAHQLGLLPSEFLGDSTVTQATSNATGVYNGYTLTSTTCVINVTNIVGSFNTTNTISIILDDTVSGFDYLFKNEINACAMGYNVVDLETLTSTYGVFYNGVVAIQALKNKNNQFNFQGYYAYYQPSINAKTVAEITSPNETFFIHAVKWDVPSSVQYPANAIMAACVAMYNDLNNELPYYGTEGASAILNLTVSGNKSSYPTDEVLNALVSQGCLPIAINSSGQAYIYRNVNTLQTLDGVVDNEYRYQGLQLKTRFLDKNILTIAEGTLIDPQTGMRLNNNEETIQNLENNENALLNNLYNKGNGIIGNTDNSATATVDSDDVTKLDLKVTTTIVPTNSGVNGTLYVYSYNG